MYRRHLQNFAPAIPKRLPVAQLRPNNVTQINNVNQIIDARDDWSPCTKYAIGGRLVAERPAKIPQFKGAKVAAGEMERARAEQRAWLAERRKAIHRAALDAAPAYSLGSFRHTFGDRALKRGVDPITVANSSGIATSRCWPTPTRT